MSDKVFIFDAAFVYFQGFSGIINEGRFTSTRSYNFGWTNKKIAFRTSITLFNTEAGVAES